MQHSSFTLLRVVVRTMRVQHVCEESREEGVRANWGPGERRRKVKEMRVSSFPLIPEGFIRFPSHDSVL